MPTSNPRPNPRPTPHGKDKTSFSRRYDSEEDAPSKIRQNGQTFYLKDFSDGRAKYSRRREGRGEFGKPRAVLKKRDRKPTPTARQAPVPEPTANTRQDRYRTT